MRRIVIAAASAAGLACLGGCAAPESSKSQAADVVEQPTATAEPTALDPFAWTDVSYQEYLDAAEQIGLRPDVLMPEAGFSSGLNALCHASAADLATMRSAQMKNTAETETYTTAKYLGDEVGLRLGLACPQRMTDWTAASTDQGVANDEVSQVTDEDLARAQAEEQASGSDTGHGDYNPTSSHDGTPDASDQTDNSTADPSGDGQVSTTSSGGVTTGNGETQP